MEARIIEVPGIPGKLQEMSLDQYMAALPADHYARKQLDELRAQALKAVEISTQLMLANEKIMDLQNKLILGIAAQPIVPAPNIISTGDPLPPANITVSSTAVPPVDPSKFQCGLCGKQLLSISGLQRHLQFKHDKKFVIKGQELVPVP